MSPPRLAAVIAALGLLLAVAGKPAAAGAGAPALVQDDGTLRVGSRSYRLYGIYIPPTARICRATLRPVRCAPRAVLELDRLIHGFVWCDPVRRNRDGTSSAVCQVRGRDSRLGSRRDLAAELLRHGWALALPHAPFEYVVLERIARAHNRGVWGFQVDSISRR